MSCKCKVAKIFHDIFSLTLHTLLHEIVYEKSEKYNFLLNLNFPLVQFNIVLHYFDFDTDQTDLFRYSHKFERLDSIGFLELLKIILSKNKEIEDLTFLTSDDNSFRSNIFLSQRFYERFCGKKPVKRLVTSVSKRQGKIIKNTSIEIWRSSVQIETAKFNSFLRRLEVKDPFTYDWMKR